MEHISTVEQLRCAGVVAAVTLARSAFPNRLENQTVRFRYSSMWEDKRRFPSAKTSSMTPEEALRCDCDAMLGCALSEREPIKDKNGNVVPSYVCGKTKSYFKAGVLEYLEANRSSGLDSQAKAVQRIVRGFLARKHLEEMLGASKKREAEEKAARERAEREARERREKEAREREEKRAREKADREAKLKAMMKKYNDQIEAVKSEIKEAEAEERKLLKEAEKRKEDAARELEELKEKTGDEARAALLDSKKLKAQQEHKLEDNTKQIEKLKKEAKKMRKDHAKMKEKYETVKNNNQKLLDNNATSGNDFENEEDDMRKVDLKNAELMDNLDQAKEANKQLKSDCMGKQDQYMAQAETRLEFQKTMARILTMIQDTSKDAKIVEDTLNVALECESSAKQTMSALEAETSSGL